MKKLFLMCILLFLAICPRIFAGEEIVVSAAASLKDAFSELGREFNKRSETKVVFNFASSGSLRIQIENGAPVDIFASASLSDMDILEKKNLLINESRINFANNMLVIVQNNNSLVKIKSLRELLDSKVKKIAIGNPLTVPAGRYAKESLMYYKLFEQLKTKLVFGEHVRQVLDYTAQNEVDAGIVYSTDTMTSKKIAVAWKIPTNAHGPIVYPMSIIKSSLHRDVAEAFIKYIISDEGKRVLEKYGFN